MTVCTLKLRDTRGISIGDTFNQILTLIGIYLNEEGGNGIRLTYVELGINKDGGRLKWILTNVEAGINVEGC